MHHKSNCRPIPVLGRQMQIRHWLDAYATCSFRKRACEVLTVPSLNTQLKFILCMNFTLGGCRVTQRGEKAECKVLQKH